MRYYFGDNQTYGADDIKAALGTFVAMGGIALDLNDNTEYDVSALNKIVGSAVCEGVVPETDTSLKLVKTDGGYEVSAGRGIFSDGGVVVLEEAETANVSAGQYVYIVYSAALDDAYITAADSELEGTESQLLIPLAYINSDGSVTDKRSFARGKVPALASATWNTLHEVTFNVDTSSITSASGSGYVEATHQTDGEINFILFESNAIMSRMSIENGQATYKWVTDIHSSNTNSGDEFLCVGNTSNGTVRATYIDSGIDYITLRYYIPKKFSSGNYTYKALIGVKAN